MSLQGVLRARYGVECAGLVRRWRLTEEPAMDRNVYDRSVMYR